MYLKSNNNNNNDNNEPAQSTNLSIKWSIHVNSLKSQIQFVYEMFFSLKQIRPEMWDLSHVKELNFTQIFFF